jgi:hypothetical protein
MSREISLRTTTKPSFLVVAETWWRAKSRLPSENVTLSAGSTYMPPPQPENSCRVVVPGESKEANSWAGLGEGIVSSSLSRLPQ